jgi:NinB protein
MHSVTLTNQFSRDRAKMLIDRAPPGYVMRIAEQKRSLEQNAKMHAMLTDISVSKPLGRRHTPDDWKAIFMNACGWECQFIEGLDGRPFPQGFRSSQLTKSQMSKLIEFMLAFGAEHGVRWTDERKEAA